MQRRKVGVERTFGGTFSITNGGGFLIVNVYPNYQPASMWYFGNARNSKSRHWDKIEIRPMMYVALSYVIDVDGKAVTFLVRIKQMLKTRAFYYRFNDLRIRPSSSQCAL